MQVTKGFRHHRIAAPLILLLTAGCAATSTENYSEILAPRGRTLKKRSMPSANRTR